MWLSLHIKYPDILREISFMHNLKIYHLPQRYREQCIFIMVVQWNEGERFARSSKHWLKMLKSEVPIESKEARNTNHRRFPRWQYLHVISSTLYTLAIHVYKHKYNSVCNSPDISRHNEFIFVYRKINFRNKPSPPPPHPPLTFVPDYWLDRITGYGTFDVQSFSCYCWDWWHVPNVRQSWKQT